MIKGLVSIIVPVYNSEKFLEKCLNSLVRQTYSNIEIIIINDGSKDNSLEICNNFSAFDNRFVIVNQKNSGVSISRNKALDIAKGEYITFVDSDDWVEEDYVLTLLNNLLSNNVQISCSAMCRDDKKGTYVVHTFDDIKLSSNDAINPKSQYYLTGIGGKLFLSSLIGNDRFDIDIKLSEDLWFYLNLVNKCDSIYWTSKPLYHYYDNNTSATHQRSATILYDDFVIRKRLVECFYDDVIYKEEARIIAYKSALKVKISYKRTGLDSLKISNVINYLTVEYKRVIKYKGLNFRDRIIIKILHNNLFFRLLNSFLKW